MILTNTCEGTSGTNVTTANSAGANQFDVITTSGAGNSLDYSNTHNHWGSTALKSLVGATSGTAYTDWAASIGGAIATLYSRVYLWIDAAPNANTRVCAYVGSASLRASLQLTTGRVIRTVNSVGTVIGTSSTVIPTGQWVRLEFDVTGNAATGVMTCRIYLNAESTTADETLNNTAQNTGGTIDTFRIGQSSAVTSTTYWLDDVGVTDVGPMGPTTNLTPIPWLHA